MGFFDFFISKWKPREGVWYRNKKKVTLITEPPKFQGDHPPVIDKEVRYTNCYIIRDGKKIRGSFKVIGDTVRFIEGWKYRKEYVKMVDKTNCTFSKSTFFVPWTYKMKIKEGANIIDSFKKNKMADKRRKGAAIVETSNGILVVSGRSKVFMLPGGGADNGESRERAAIRELKEETDLDTKEIKFLFSYIGGKWHTHSGKQVRNHTKVFLIKASGVPRPRHEIKYIDFWKPESKIRLTTGTKIVIERYLKEFK